MAEEGSKDEERALLVAQINSLDEQQQRYLECDVVDKHNEDMTSLCDALRVDQSQSSEKHVRLNELDLLKEKVLSEKLKHQAAINCLNDSLDETDECGNKQRQDTLERRIMENTSRILRGDRASHSEQLESLQFLILEESSLLKEKADLERKFSDLHLWRNQLKKDHEIALKSFINSKEEKTQVSNVLMKMQMKQKKAVTTAHKQNKALRKRASMNFPSKDGSDPTREKLQKERSRIGKLETIMQDGDIFVNQIMTGSEKSGWKTQWLLETLHSLCPPTLGERPRPQRPAQKEPKS
ncbi:Nuclear mitotic apparatus protein 1 [Dissostichus eleginoides]|uniref:Nuclear mitotic apparatus protein 1 n=1 Tax=Dissostichus eleginoides TaxID=100907 RepID=A0AAD9BXB5_DISEL|nr:Nuclear mitotic apparatus protein 1 [Dissostichus eleginoides]